MNRSSPWLSVAFLVVIASFLAAADAKDEAALEISKDEQVIIDLTNQARAKEKLPPLKPNAILFKAARAHSVNQAKQEKMEHILDGKSPSDRADAAGYDFEFIGENVSQCPAPLRIKAVFEGWMKSPEHRKNILDKDFQEIGIGLAKSGKGAFYLTQVFGTPQK